MTTATTRPGTYGTPPNPWNRDARIAYVWRTVHPDYKLERRAAPGAAPERCVLVFEDYGSTLRALDSMPDDLLERLSRRMGGR